MDLVRELKEVRFELALRGYDCEAVDAFLAKLRGDLQSAQESHEDQRARIAELEGMIEDGGGSSETEGTLRRTLVLAQRLADETEVEAKKAAAELVDAATAESEAMRSAAETEAVSMREAGKAELDGAREEAEAIRETLNEESAKGRAVARAEAEAILTQAEATGVERVAAIENTAQEEATAMREPIRAEVVELEGVRERLLTDIAELESHLEEQRVRVRTAVEALRVGMSGSIEDLERVAEDDELLATQPAPEHSASSSSDVAEAPDIEIVDRVESSAPPPPTVDEVEEVALASVVPIDIADDAAEEAGAEIADAAEVDESIEAEVEAEAEADESDTAVGADDVFAMADTPDVAEPEDPASDEDVEEVAEAAATDGWISHDGDGDDVAVPIVAESDVFDEVDSGPMTEPIPVVEIASESDLAEAELVVLDEEPSALFGTDVGDDASLESTDETAAPSGPSFVQRFAEAVDELPISESN